MKVLVTGITGFVGSAVARTMRAAGWNVVGQSYQSDSREFPVEKLPISSQTDWMTLLHDVDLVIHCAACAPRKGVNLNLNDYLEINTKGTIALAQQSAAQGVKRFIFISSVKVNGETSQEGHPINQESIVAPEDDYGISKHKAEQALLEINKVSDMEVTIVRPPLVYGPGVNSNFSTLLKLAAQKIPLPFGSVSNKRSLVFIDNLVDLIVTLTNHADVSGKTFFVSDDHDVSTTELLRTIGLAMNAKVKLLPIPTPLIIGLCRLLGRNNISDKLLRSLQVDITSTKVDLGWHPPVTFEQGIAVTVSEYLARQEQDR